MKRTPETEDLAIMADPATYYREHGGELFLAMLDGLVVDAVAVKKLGDAGFEFCKLVVAQQARAHGAGRALASGTNASLSPPSKVGQRFFSNHLTRWM
jgi:hypothetical protein